MSLEAGHKLAHYEIVAPIGKGGMGEVYQATDKKLGRDVAIKVLPEAFAEDEERLRRFQREAKVLASLNHPNIAAIYGLEQSGTTHYLVLELVPGETLAERIARGPIPLDEALDIAIKIAEALEEAHAHGVVHRDLKPANIMLTPDGKVKVLDFGLAKAFAEEAPDVDNSMSPTITRDATRIGVILGTAGYMSPEQAKGKTLDKRTDNFAFGVVLYEMLSSKKAFPGDDVSEVLASVIKLEPDWSALPASVPRRVQRVLRRCLEKDASRRCHDVADARIDLEDDGVDAPPRVSKPRRLIAVGISLAMLAFVTGWLWPRGATSIGIERFAVPLDPALQIGSSKLAFSPDSRELVFSALRGNEWQLYRRSRGELEVVPIPGSDGATAPFFSPAGDWLGFYTETGELKKMSWPSPGAPLIVSDTARRGFVGRASWSDDDTIVFTSGGQQIMRVPAGGGVPKPVTAPTETGGRHYSPQLLPNGRWILFTVGTGPGVGEVAIASSETGEWRVLENGIRARYVSTGHLLYVSNGALWAKAFDSNEGQALGDAVRMINEAVQFEVADDGTLAYVDGDVVQAQKLVWVSRSGTETPALDPSEAFQRPRVSPDGRRLIVEIVDNRRGDLWIYDLERGTRTRLTFEDSNTDPAWAPDGTHVTYARGPASQMDIARRPSDGTGQTQTLIGGDSRRFPHSWSPDGRVLAFYELGANAVGGRDIWTLSLDDDSEPEPFLRTPFNERSPSFSPDGRYLAYTSDESGDDEIYIQAFPGPGAKITVSRNGGHEPVWSRDGSELFFRNGRAVWAAAVTPGPSLHGLDVSEPTLLFDGPYISRAGGTGGSQSYDVAPDGRFLMIKPNLSASGRLVVVLNWVEELKRLVPSKP